MSCMGSFNSKCKLPPGCWMKKALRMWPHGRRPQGPVWAKFRFRAEAWNSPCGEVISDLSEVIRKITNSFSHFLPHEEKKIQPVLVPLSAIQKQVSGGAGPRGESRYENSIKVPLYNCTPFMATTLFNVYLAYNTFHMPGHFIKLHNGLLKLSVNSWSPCFSVG